MFKGYKTYIIGVTTVLGAVAAYLVGDATIAQTAQLVVTAILAMTLRHGVS